MPISYPTSLDTLTNPAAGDATTSPSHATQHSNANDAIEAIEAKVGIGSSTPTANTVLTGTATGTSAWSTPGVRVYRKAIAYNDAGITTGVTIYTPAVGEVLLDAWFHITTAWDGTTPRGDIGQFAAGNDGWFKLVDDFAAIPYMDYAVASADDALSSGLGTYENSALSTRSANIITSASPLVPLVFASTTPVKYVVTQTGAKGGAATGATQGAGFVYLVIATPVAL